jgi:FMN phosphatase YigB (HAD superfamily)
VRDNPENGILPAAAVGMTPIWLDHFSSWPEGNERPRYVAHRLEDVVGILREIMGSAYK